MSDRCEQRRQRLRAAMHRGGVDAALVTNLVNIRYLTGFTGSSAALLVTPDTTLLATDGRYELQVSNEAPDVDVVIDRRLGVALLDAPTSSAAGVVGPVKTIGFEDHHVTVAVLDALTSAAGSRALVRIGRAVESLRAVKDDGELALIRSACEITDAAYADLLVNVAPRMTETAVARYLDQSMVDHGADGPAFETIVASGDNGALPHHRAADRALRPGDLVTCDFGACVEGYRADMTRTFAIGHVDDWQREVYGVVGAAYEAARSAVAVDAECRAVDATARAVVDATAYSGRFVHGLGHGVGLEIHEEPWLGQTATGTLAEGNTVTVEPGVYLPGRGGVRLEDTLVVRSGVAEALTRSSRELVVV